MGIAELCEVLEDFARFMRLPFAAYALNLDLEDLLAWVQDGHVRIYHLGGLTDAHIHIYSGEFIALQNRYEKEGRNLLAEIRGYAARAQEAQVQAPPLLKLLGYVHRELNSRREPDRSWVTTFPVAVKRMILGPRQPHYMCEAQGELAQQAQEELSQGMLVYVEGPWQDEPAPGRMKLSVLQPLGGSMRPYPAWVLEE
jgi:hypothetical protein